MRFTNAVAVAFGELKAELKFPSVAKPTDDVRVLQLVTQDEYTGKPPVYNAVALAKLYDNNPWARSIVQKIAQGVARQRWYFEDKAGERVDEHPALDFIRAGCKGLRGRKAMRATQVILELQGECFWIIGRNAQGVPVGFAPIPSHWVIDTPGKTFKGFRIQPRSGVAFELGAEHVIHFREPNPVDPYARGTSPANAARVELECSEAAAGFLNNYFRNNARPDFFVTGTEKATLTEVDVARLEERLQQKHRGFKRAGRPLISTGPLDVKTLNSGLRDNQVVEVAKLSKEDVAEFWNMPPELLGRLTSSNKATIDNAEALFARHLIDPRLAFIEDDLQPFIEENFDISGLELRYESPIQEDKAFALEAVKTRSTAFSDNEVRKLANHKAVDGKDEFPEVPEPIEPGAEPGKKPKPNAKKPPAKAIAAAVVKILDLQDVVQVSDAIDDPSVRAEVTRLMDSIYAELVSKVGSELLDMLEAEADFQVYGRVAEFVASEVPELVGRINATTRKELLAALTEGAAAGESVEDLISRVESAFEEAGRIRASTIGDTVATKIAGFAAQEAAEQAGFSQKKWLSSRDQVVRQTHGALDGQVKQTKEPFQSASGARAQHPGAFGIAAEDINCRCAMRPLLEGEKAAPLSDDKYAAKYETSRARAARRMAKAVREVFAGQRAVVVAELNRIGEYRR